MSWSESDLDLYSVAMKHLDMSTFWTACASKTLCFLGAKREFGPPTVTRWCIGQFLIPNLKILPTTITAVSNGIGEVLRKNLNRTVGEWSIPTRAYKANGHVMATQQAHTPPSTVITRVSFDAFWNAIVVNASSHRRSLGEHGLGIVTLSALSTAY